MYTSVHKLSITSHEFRSELAIQVTIIYVGLTFLGFDVSYGDLLRNTEPKFARQILLRSNFSITNSLSNEPRSRNEIYSNQINLFLLRTFSEFPSLANYFPSKLILYNKIRYNFLANNFFQLP